MNAARKLAVLALCVAEAACANAPGSDARSAAAAIDSLNSRVVNAYRKHDAKAYGTLYTDSAVFEWPAFNSVRGPAGMEAMARDNWTSLRNMDLELDVATRRFAADHVTEFGAFQQSWDDSTGKRMTEFGRYVSVLVPAKDGRWLMDRFFGFEDSTRATPAPGKMTGHR